MSQSRVDVKLAVGLGFLEFVHAELHCRRWCNTVMLANDSKSWRLCPADIRMTSVGHDNCRGFGTSAPPSRAAPWVPIQAATLTTVELLK